MQFSYNSEHKYKAVVTKKSWSHLRIALPEELQALPISFQEPVSNQALLVNIIAILALKLKLLDSEEQLNSA